MDETARTTVDRYDPAIFDLLTGVFIALWLFRIVPDNYIVLDIGASLSARLLIRVNYDEIVVSGGDE